MIDERGFTMCQEVTQIIKHVCILLLKAYSGIAITALWWYTVSQKMTPKTGWDNFIKTGPL